MDYAESFRKNGVKDSKKTKSNLQEKRIAKMVGGRPTVMSGAVHFDKADVIAKDIKLRIECKRTDGVEIGLKKEWLKKLRNSCGANEIPALAIEISGEEWFLVRPEEFEYIKDQERRNK